MRLLNSRFVLRAVALACFFCASSAQAQKLNIRVSDVGYPTGTERAAEDSLNEVPVRVSADGRHVRFPLQITVRNDDNNAGRFKIQLWVRGARPLSVTPVYSISPGETRQIAYNLDADFASRAASTSTVPGSTTLPAPTPVIVLPSNPVPAEIRVYSDAGTELDRRPFHILLRDSPSTVVRRFDRDLIVESATISISRPQAAGGGRVVTAGGVISNNGSATWTFPGNVSFELQRGTPETGLAIIGARGMPTTRSLPLSRGLGTRGIDTVTTRLQTRVRATGPTNPGQIIRVNPPLRPGVWYTLTVSTASASDLDPSNDSVQLIFMLNNDMSISDSRIERVTNRARVAPAR
jgi:hypothetical protein